MTELPPHQPPGWGSSPQDHPTPWPASAPPPPPVGPWGSATPTPTPWGGAPSPSAQAWGQSPQPGIIPLRPLSVGEILDGAVKALRFNPRVMFGFTTVVAVVASLILVLIQVLSFNTFLTEGSLDFEATSSSEFFSTISGLIAASLVSLLVYLAAFVFIIGTLVGAVSDAVIGRKPSPGDILRRIGKRGFLRLTGLMLTLQLVPTLVLVLLGLIIAGLFALATPAGVIALLILFPTAIILGTFIAIKILYCIPALVLEKLTVRAAIVRSWQLIRGAWWRTFGIYFLVNFIINFVSQIVQLPFGFIASAMGGLVAAGTDQNNSVLAGVVAIVVLGSVLAILLIGPFYAGIISLMYVDQRIRSEGLDVSLAQAAQNGPAR